MNEDKIKLIDDFVSGNLTGEELQDFQRELKSNTKLADAVNALLVEGDAMELLAEKILRKQIDEEYQLLETTKEVKKEMGYKRFYILLGLLAMAVLAVYLLKKDSSGQEKEYYAQNKEDKSGEQAVNSDLPFEKENNASTVQVETSPSENSIPEKIIKPILKPLKANAKAIVLSLYTIPGSLLGTRGEVEEGSDYALAVTAFESKNYKEVIRLLPNLSEEADPEVFAMRAHAYFNVGNYSAATRDFKVLEGGGIYTRDAEWFGLLSVIAAGTEKEEIWHLKLKKILSNSNHPFLKEANSLAKKLNISDGPK